MKGSLRTSVVVLASAAAVAIVVVAGLQTWSEQVVSGGYSSEPLQGQVQGRRFLENNGEPLSTVDSNESSSSSSSSSEAELLMALTEKLSTPRELAMDPSVPNQLATHQFIHLHHMKTGGTSMDRYLDCVQNLLRSDQQLTVPHSTVHECSRGYYLQCKSGQDASCHQKVAEAAMLSYCAPLKDLPSFSWGALDEETGTNVTVPPSHGAITVLRDPVDRVWSMYRFQTKACFQCKPLIDIYRAMDAGNMLNMEVTCYQQLLNHQVANLLSSEWLDANGSTGKRRGRQQHRVLQDNVANANSSTTTTNIDESDEDDAMLAEAIKNMKSFFTVIGLTEHLDETIDIAGRVFPWMKPQVDWSSQQCTLSHANASPQNNRCGPDGTHWALPSRPDDATRAAIEAHNRLDRKLYAAAVQHFQLQKRALAIGQEQT